MVRFSDIEVVSCAGVLSWCLDATQASGGAGGRTAIPSASQQRPDADRDDGGRSREEAAVGRARPQAAQLLRVAEAAVTAAAQNKATRARGRCPLSRAATTVCFQSGVLPQSALHPRPNSLFSGR